MQLTECFYPVKYPQASQCSVIIRFFLLFRLTFVLNTKTVSSVCRI